MTVEEMEKLRCGDFVVDKNGEQWTVVSNYGSKLKVISQAVIINEDLCEHYDVVENRE